MTISRAIILLSDPENYGKAIKVRDKIIESYCTKNRTRFYCESPTDCFETNSLNDAITFLFS